MKNKIRLAENEMRKVIIVVSQKPSLNSLVFSRTEPDSNERNSDK